MEEYTAAVKRNKTAVYLIQQSCTVSEWAIHWLGIIQSVPTAFSSPQWLPRPAPLSQAGYMKYNLKTDSLHNVLYIFLLLCIIIVDTAFMYILLVCYDCTDPSIL